ncbi:hypothetical protein EV715DRAFT_290671 [Schizophyllum commune]
MAESIPPQKDLPEDSSLRRARQLATLDMVNSGTVLDRAQKDAIKQSTASLTVELARVEAEARRLDALRRELISQLGINEALVAPIRGLPHDVLSEIFREVVSRYRAASRNLGTPAIARICREWRAIALRDPRLWTVINIQSNRKWAEPVKATIGSYLSRSAELPLHFRAMGNMNDPDPSCSCTSDDDGCDCGEGPSPADIFALHAIEHIATLSAHRWKSLDLSGHRDIFDQWKRPYLPILDSITISARISFFGRHDLLTLDFLARSPRLRMMTLCARFACFHLPRWESLKHATYVLDECSEDEYTSIGSQLHRQGQLETLAVLEQDNRDEFDTATRYGHILSYDIALLHLATITVSGLGHFILCSILAPELQKLVVRDGLQDGYTKGALSSILSMDTICSLRSLRTLELVRVTLDEEVGMDIVYQFLERLSALESLHIESARGYSDEQTILRYELLVWLTRTPEASARLPNLTDLVLYFGKARHKGAKSRLRNLLASRESSGSAEGVSLSALTRFRTDISKELQMG